MRKIFGIILTVFLLLPGCKSGSHEVSTGTESGQTPATSPYGAFARGADVSWVTQQEKEGIKFFSPAPEKKEMECMELLRDYCGVDAIRLRVWVNPADGWNGLSDLLVKAKRAHNLGLRLMIDFHLSDVWADPGHQVIPAAWVDYNESQMAQAINDHIVTTLNALKDAGIEPEWVQVGNETTPGMLLPMGSVENPATLVALSNAGYDAVKKVFPRAKVITHLDGGHDQWRYDRMFDIFERYGGKYDMIGMSVYPYWAEQEGVEGGWQKIIADCKANIAHLKEKYKKPVMVCEIGFPYDQGERCAETIPMLAPDVEGIFYWEPQAPAGYNGGYTLGCFENGSPTVALMPFKDMAANQKN